MDELCPLCLKMGSNKRITAVQINLDEAVWMCENEKCPWPFGYEKSTFLLRKVGVKWSNEWETYKKVQKQIGPIPVSTELSLYTPPVTPSSDTATKESAKSDYAGEPNGAARIDNVAKILASTDDSYAPKLCQYDKRANNEHKERTRLADIIPQCLSTECSALMRKAIVPQSIFDIDVVETRSDEAVNVKDFDQMKDTNVLSARRLRDDRDSSQIIDTVLKTSAPMERSADNLCRLKEKEFIFSPVGDDAMKKARPQIKSISDAKIELQLIDRSRVTVNEKLNSEISINSQIVRLAERTEQPAEPRTIGHVHSVRKGKKSDLPESSDMMNIQRDVAVTSNNETVISAKQRASNCRQCTATITVDGSLPVILSYDLSDLEEKSDKMISVASTSINECTEKDRTSQRKDAKKIVTETSGELPKKRMRPAIKRRATSIGKQYEKFSFSALKKNAHSSKHCYDKPNNTDVASTVSEAVNLDEISTKADNSFILKAMNESVEKTADIGISDVSNRLVESLYSINVNSGNTRMTNDDPIDENLNLSSVLDDILIDGYQNATANLNDDWLESFFT